MTRLLHRSGGAVSVWEKVRAEGVCRLCLRPAQVRRLTRHHLVPRCQFLKGMGGRTYSGAHETAMIPGEYRNRIENVIPLCRQCHDRVDNGGGNDRMIARRQLRACLSQAEVSFVIMVRGSLWLDRHYPRRTV